MAWFKNLFTKKATLGDGLKAFKKAFGVVGDDLAKTPGQRLYKGKKEGTDVFLEIKVGDNFKDQALVQRLGLRKFIPKSFLNMRGYTNAANVGKPGKAGFNVSVTRSFTEQAPGVRRQVRSIEANFAGEKPRTFTAQKLYRPMASSTIPVVKM